MKKRDSNRSPPHRLTVKDSITRAVSEALEPEDLRDHALQITEEPEQTEIERTKAEPTEEPSDFELSM